MRVEDVRWQEEGRSMKVDGGRVSFGMYGTLGEVKGCHER